MTKRKSQRGYTLLELAIIVTVVLMMGSWLVTNYYQWEKQNREQETERAIESIKEAIVTYAADHTAKSNILINDDATRVQRWRLPSGRPYLPCPDITGDGVEDRRPLVAAATTALTLRATVSALEAGGDCYNNKGWVPWKTLNVPPADPWGNAYTYRVDNHFSNAMLGFDHQTVADQASYTRPLKLLTVSSPTTNITLGAVREPIDLTARIERVVVTSSAPSAVTAVWGADTTLFSENSPSLICSSAPCPFSSTVALPTTIPFSLSLVAGRVAVSSLTVEAGGYDLTSPVYAVHRSGGVVSGPPVVILSHGLNGYGAARQVGRAGVIQCNDVPDSRTEELQNAFRYVGVTSTVIVNTVTLSYRCPAETLPGYRQNGFVTHPRTDSAAAAGGGFDDIVGWMSTEELVSSLRERGALPVGLLPPVGLEDY